MNTNCTESYPNNNRNQICGDMTNKPKINLFATCICDMIWSMNASVGKCTIEIQAKVGSLQQGNT